MQEKLLNQIQISMSTCDAGSDAAGFDASGFDAAGVSATGALADFEPSGTLVSESPR